MLIKKSSKRQEKPKLSHKTKNSQQNSKVMKYLQLLDKDCQNVQSQEASCSRPAEIQKYQYSIQKPTQCYKTRFYAHRSPIIEAHKAKKQNFNKCIICSKNFYLSKFNYYQCCKCKSIIHVRCLTNDLNLCCHIKETKIQHKKNANNYSRKQIKHKKTVQQPIKQKRQKQLQQFLQQFHQHPQNYALLDNLKLGFEEEVQQFKKKYPYYFISVQQKMYLQFPIADELFGKYEFLIKQPIKQYPSLYPSRCINNLGNMIELWNFYRTQKIKINGSQNMRLQNFICVFMSDRHYYIVIYPILKLIMKNLEYFIKKKQYCDIKSQKFLSLALLRDYLDLNGIEIIFQNQNILGFIFRVIIQTNQIFINHQQIRYHSTNKYQPHQQQSKQQQQNQNNLNYIIDPVIQQLRKALLQKLHGIFQKGGTIQNSQPLINLQIRSELSKLFIEVCYINSYLIENSNSQKQDRSKKKRIREYRRTQTLEKNRVRISLQKLIKTKQLCLKKINAQKIRIQYIQKYSEQQPQVIANKKQEYTKQIQSLQFEIQEIQQMIQESQAKLDDLSKKDAIYQFCPQILQQGIQDDIENIPKNVHFIGKFEFGVHLWYLLQSSQRILVYEQNRQRWGFYDQKQIDQVIDYCNVKASNQKRIKQKLKALKKNFDSENSVQKKASILSILQTSEKIKKIESQQVDKKQLSYHISNFVNEFVYIVRNPQKTNSFLSQIQLLQMYKMVENAHQKYVDWKNMKQSWEKTESQVNFKETNSKQPLCIFQKFIQRQQIFSKSNSFNYFVGKNKNNYFWKYRPRNHLIFKHLFCCECSEEFRIFRFIIYYFQMDLFNTYRQNWQNKKKLTNPNFGLKINNCSVKCFTNDTNKKVNFLE